MVVADLQLYCIPLLVIPHLFLFLYVSSAETSVKNFHHNLNNKISVLLQQQKGYPSRCSQLGDILCSDVSVTAKSCKDDHTRDSNVVFHFDQHGCAPGVHVGNSLG